MLQRYCRPTRNCWSQVVRDVARQDLPKLYSKAAVVYETCMVGTERMPVEATLYGAILFSSTRCSLLIYEKRDWPIPSRNIVDFANITNHLAHILDHYEEEYRDQQAMRELYGVTLSHESLMAEALRFYHYATAIDTIH
jgi:hypothetical protein